jgi:hypothetical protein
MCVCEKYYGNNKKLAQSELAAYSAWVANSDSPWPSVYRMSGQKTLILYKFA